MAIAELQPGHKLPLSVGTTEVTNKAALEGRYATEFPPAEVVVEHDLPSGRSQTFRVPRAGGAIINNGPVTLLVQTLLT